MLVPQDAAPGELERLTKLYGFDRPLYLQYFEFLQNAVTGSFPDSLRYGGSPVGLILERLPATLLLGGTGLALGVLIGVAVGYHVALREDRGRSSALVSVLSALEAVPSFFFGVILLSIFAVALRALPLQGDDSAASLILPAITIGVATAAPIARVTRVSVLDNLHADHVAFAQAKGVRGGLLQLRHVALNSLGPVVSALGTSAGVLLGGAIVTESVFGWPGVGQLTISAISGRDYPVVLASVVLIAAGFTLATLLADLATIAIDPQRRRRHEL
jgi:peptide/nickel transport system permease protein